MLLRPGVHLNAEIRCPCSKCGHLPHHNKATVTDHLLRYGFMDAYSVWWAHGETLSNNVDPWLATSDVASSSNVEEHVNIDEHVNAEDDFHHMVYDAFCPSENDHPRNETEFASENVGDAPNRHAQSFYDLLRASTIPLGPSSNNQTLLGWLSYMLHCKAKNNITGVGYNDIIQGCRQLLSPEDQQKVPSNFYEAKKFMKNLGLGYVKIDACVNNCFLYYGDEAKSLTTCPVCGEPRYKKCNSGQTQKKGRPRNSLWYLPIIPRLQRLYMSRKTAEHMTWHLKCRVDSEILIHPAQSTAWKHFDAIHPSFASDPRNVRLGLATDGFNPWGHFSRSYSCWPVFIVVYNLPPEMCMRPEFTFLTLVISGPKSPGKNIDVFLRPLIDDLKRLWLSGVETFDSFHKQNFTMRAMLMWTITDFPGYGMVSGWSTHGRLSCPYCMEMTRAFYLQYSRKICFFDCHRQFLPASHSYRMDASQFLKGHLEFGPPPTRLDGHFVRLRVAALPDVLFGNPSVNQIIPGFGETHNWVKRSIFWELSYWGDNLIRHNLDVMHSPIAFRGLLPDSIWGPLTEVSNFFRALCSPNVNIKDMAVWETKIVELIWNKNHVEASIVEAYILNEITRFCSRYFGADLETSWSKPPRNFAAVPLYRNTEFSIFACPGHPMGSHLQTRCLTTQEMKAAELYVLLNCREVDALLSIFDREVGVYMTPLTPHEARTRSFVMWFKDRVLNGYHERNEVLQYLALDPSWTVNVYRGTTISDDAETDYYGILNEVIELLYYGPHAQMQTIVLFNCDWFDTRRGTRVNQVYNIVDVNPRYQLSTGEPFCFACQATQVYYSSYPSDNRATHGWFAACKIRHRHLVNASSTSLDMEEIFQDEEPPSTQSNEHSSNLTSTERVNLHAEGATMVDLNGDANDDVDENPSEGNEGYETRGDVGDDSSETE
ncbi:hypothetical protein SLEP1_g47607 [Rubroshorea leprosula]|uniref:Transposase-associated domain-containing protein n=1 Tax=Rubroshorea leprosula TaxID=152421 RepID=A0AAV5LTS1_9ROSI|nr:hypothetical protein SLEP1_g47607 [Rubroshorea leprosula]